MKLPNASLLKTRIMMLLSAAGLIVMQYLPDIVHAIAPTLVDSVKNPLLRAALSAVLVSYLTRNHQIAAKSFPDGTPVTTAAAKLEVSETGADGETKKTIEVTTDTPQPAKEPTK